MRSAIALLLLLLAVGAIGVVVGRSVAPPAAPPTRADVEKATGLDRIVAEVNFSATPIGEAIEFLRRKTRADIRVKWGELESAGVDRHAPINLRVANLPLRRVLELVCDEAGGATVILDAREHDGEIVLSTTEDNSRDAQVRLYDVQDLLQAHYDLRVRLGWQPPSPSTSAAAATGAGGPGGMIFGNPPQSPYDEAMQSLKVLIMETVAPAMWRENGGTIAAFREYDGRLFIVATPDMHDQIRELLALTRSDEPAAAARTPVREHSHGPGSRPAY
jgi:hypothetical protein